MHVNLRTINSCSHRGSGGHDDRTPSAWLGGFGYEWPALVDLLHELSNMVDCLFLKNIQPVLLAHSGRWVQINQL